jgi:lipoyl synthase
MKRQGGPEYNRVRRLLRDASLHTVCESANCPNRGECFAAGTATFLLMGDTCTRHCTFCNIPDGHVEPLDPGEPQRVAETVRHLGLRFAVVTSVTRDDLPDGGAAHIAATIAAVRRLNPGCGIEVLIPDLRGNERDLQTVLKAAPDVLNHNLETVPRLYRDIRPEASYEVSLQVLSRASRWAETAGRSLIVKTGIMAGLGETRPELASLMSDAARCGARIMTIGQYLQPTAAHHPVVRYLEPAEFTQLADLGRTLGLMHVEAGPLVRSSYHARELARGHERS